MDTERCPAQSGGCMQHIHTSVARWPRVGSHGAAQREDEVATVVSGVHDTRLDVAVVCRELEWISNRRYPVRSSLPLRSSGRSSSRRRRPGSLNRGACSPGAACCASRSTGLLGLRCSSGLRAQRWRRRPSCEFADVRSSRFLRHLHTSTGRTLQSYDDNFEVDVPTRVESCYCILYLVRHNLSGYGRVGFRSQFCQNLM